MQLIGARRCDGVRRVLKMQVIEAKN